MKPKVSGPDEEFYEIFKEQIMPILNLFQKNKEEEIFPHLFYEANITLVPKLDKDITRKEN